MTRSFRHGLVVGKFYPPHAGHMELIRDAAGLCERVSVVVAANTGEVISLAARVEWLGWECAGWPNVSVIGTIDDHTIDYEDPRIWDAHESVFRDAVAEIGRGVDVDAVFTAEDYGDELARRFDAAHVRHHRTRNGRSGTRLRADLHTWWHDLVPAARIGLATRIVVVGAESTGTTTLARDLARAVNGAFVPEYGRVYSAAKLANARQLAYVDGEPVPWMGALEWTTDEFTTIAARQTASIDAACLASSIIVADTDALATSVWHDRYVGGPHPPALSLARARPPDLYILTDPDGVPFDQDGLRDGESIRASMHEQFIRELDASDTVDASYGRARRPIESHLDGVPAVRPNQSAHKLSAMSPSPKSKRRSTRSTDRSQSRAEQDTLDTYDPRAFPPFAVTVDLAVFTVRAGLLQVLLVRRGEPPFKGDWALPGGFVRQRESIDQAAARELSEETGLTNVPAHLEQLATYGAPDRDPRMRIVSVAHVALLPDLPLPTAGGDASEARFWPIEDLAINGASRPDSPPIAFDHAELLADALERVRSKLEYTTLATAFCVEPFSLADLRRIYVAAWGNAPELANFRRKVLSTEGFVLPEHAAPAVGSRGRPPLLYRRGPATRLHPPILRTETEASTDG